MGCGFYQDCGWRTGAGPIRSFRTSCCSRSDSEHGRGFGFGFRFPECAWNASPAVLIFRSGRAGQACCDAYHRVHLHCLWFLSRKDCRLANAWCRNGSPNWTDDFAFQALGSPSRFRLSSCLFGTMTIFRHRRCCWQWGCNVHIW